MGSAEDNCVCSTCSHASFPRRERSSLRVIRIFEKSGVGLFLAIDGYRLSAPQVDAIETVLGVAAGASAGVPESIDWSSKRFLGKGETNLKCAINFLHSFRAKLSDGLNDPLAINTSNQIALNHAVFG
jgi:hypothetical protein